MSTVLVNFDAVNGRVPGTTLFASIFRFTIKDSLGNDVATKDVTFPSATISASFDVSIPGNYTMFGQLVDATNVLIGNQASFPFTVSAAETGFPEPQTITVTVS